jgi:hypothetical protein
MANGTPGPGRTWGAWRQRREQHWRSHVAAWRRSGGSQAEYCRRHNLNPAYFSFWKYELARRDERAKPEAAFVPIKLEPAVVTEIFVCEVLLRNGRRLRLGPQISAARVEELATALERLPPC